SFDVRAVSPIFVSSANSAVSLIEKSLMRPTASDPISMTPFLPWMEAMGHVLVWRKQKTRLSAGSWNLELGGRYLPLPLPLPVCSAVSAGGGVSSREGAPLACGFAFVKPRDSMLWTLCGATLTSLPFGLYIFTFMLNLRFGR